MAVDGLLDDVGRQEAGCFVVPAARTSLPVPFYIQSKASLYTTLFSIPPEIFLYLSSEYIQSSVTSRLVGVNILLVMCPRTRHTHLIKSACQ